MLTKDVTSLFTRFPSHHSAEGTFTISAAHPEHGTQPPWSSFLSPTPHYNTLPYKTQSVLNQGLQPPRLPRPITRAVSPFLPPSTEYHRPRVQARKPTSVSRLRVVWILAGCGLTVVWLCRRGLHLASGLYTYHVTCRLIGFLLAVCFHSLSILHFFYPGGI